MKISIVVPCFNEEANINLVLDELIIDLKSLKYQAEIIVINDGSTDDTYKIVNNYNSQYIKLINHTKNQGFGAAFWSGVNKSSGDYVIMVPGDGEARFRNIIYALQLIDHVDLIIPFFMNKNKRNFFRRLISFLFTKVINLTFGLSLNYTNGTIIYPKKELIKINSKSKGFLFQVEILVKLIKSGLIYAEVPVKLNSRISGKSKAIKFKTFINVCFDYLVLINDIYFKKK